jgi:hypothetical protein
MEKADTTKRACNIRPGSNRQKFINLEVGEVLTLPKEATNIFSTRSVCTTLAYQYDRKYSVNIDIINKTINVTRLK